ncbi:MAG: ROK family protein, partial [Ruminococcaceae bacterium]|nr:ROK family protein [Oscillospiraceae bacterium]
RRGDKRSVEVWEKYLRALARGIADVRALLDCRVVIGGAITPYLERYLETLRGYVAEYNFYESEGDFVRLCRHKTKSTCVGVATIFVSKYVAEI